MTDSFRQTVNAICAGCPGAVCSDPWGGGHDAWKVGDKMFACLGAVDPGVSVKCADVETAAMLIDAGVGTRAPYFHKSWVRLPAGRIAAPDHPVLRPDPRPPAQAHAERPATAHRRRLTAMAPGTAAGQPPGLAPGPLALTKTRPSGWTRRVRASITSPWTT
ncbi:MmcQ/YjbR family DNA-binding protein [Fluviibacterium sp. S390]|uniref:MmcQ/YjbR family DNA-binding protein n=1 Tax=Fluviibacterium sp. S390 TaxID=3415139 RepID=UPI003C79C594